MGSHKKAKILAHNRKNHQPIETLLNVGSFGKKDIPCYDPVLGELDSVRNNKGLNSDAI